MCILEREMLADILLAKTKDGALEALQRAKDWANNLTGEDKLEYCALLYKIADLEKGFKYLNNTY